MLVMLIYKILIEEQKLIHYMNENLLHDIIFELKKNFREFIIKLQSL